MAFAFGLRRVQIPLANLVNFASELTYVQHYIHSIKIDKVLSCSATVIPGCQEDSRGCQTAFTEVRAACCNALCFLADECIIAPPLLLLVP